MSQLIQIRRGLAADGLSRLLAIGELALFTDTMQLRCGDGFTAGGRLVANISNLPSGSFTPAFNSLSDLEGIITRDSVNHISTIPVGLIVPGLVGGNIVYYQLRADDTGIHPNDFNDGSDPDTDYNLVSWHAVSPVPGPAGSYMPAYTSLLTLQAIATAGGSIPVGMCVPGIIAGARVEYQLLADGAGVKPNDYDGATNIVSWHQVA